MTVPRTELTSPLIACSLDGKGQRARLEDWAELANTATSREELPDGFRYTFAGDDDLEARIRELAAAEQDCCSFLRLEVTRIADQIEMTVKAPADGLEALRFIFRRLKLKAARSPARRELGTGIGTDLNASNRP